MEQFRNCIAVRLPRQSLAKRITDGLQLSQPVTGRAMRRAPIAGLSIALVAFLGYLAALLCRWRRTSEQIGHAQPDGLHHILSGASRPAAN